MALSQEAQTTQLQALLKEQEELCNQLNNEYVNYKKSALEYRGKLEYVNKKINKVCGLFKTLENNHGILVTMEDQTANYFVDDFFSQYSRFHSKNLQIMLDDQEKITSNIPPVDVELLPSDVTTKVSSNFAALNLPTTDNEAIEKEVQRLIQTQKTAFFILQGKIEKARAKIMTMSSDLVEVYINNISGQWDKIFEVNRKLFFLKDDPQPYNIDMYSELEDNVEITVAELMGRKKDMEGNDFNTSLSSNRPRSERTGINDALHLPKVQIPKFDGSVLSWHAFKNLFIQMVDNTRISDTQKLFYLKSNLTGDAANMVTMMDLNLDTYQRAWDRLCSKYDNNRMLTCALADRLFSQTSFKEESSEALRSLKDVTKEVLSSLKHLKIEVTSCEPLIIFLLLKKLDSKSRMEFEYQLKNPRENPKLDDFYDFLERRSQALEGLCKLPKPKAKSVNVNVSTSSEKPEGCQHCKESHSLDKCKRFAELPNFKKWNVLRFSKSCNRCLRRGHYGNTCTAKCSKCGGTHHVLFHKDKEDGGSRQDGKNDVKSVEVQLHVVDSKGRYVVCRALLDSCSQVNVISSRLVKRLGLKKIHSTINISGIGKAQILPVSDCSVLEIKSVDGSFSSKIEAVILANISNYQPSGDVDLKEIIMKRNVCLSDPSFFKSDSIDLLLSAEIVPKVDLDKSIRLGNDLPYLKLTRFGWVVIGLYKKATLKNTFCGLSVEELDFQLNAPRLWDMDFVTDKKATSIQEKLAEEFFEKTTVKDSSGRFVVKLPKALEPIDLGDTFQIAFKRFVYLERRFQKDAEFFKKYYNFLNEYLSLDHMEKISREMIPKQHCFIPHHAVFKEDSSTTNIRVVFDASCKGSKNISLNSTLLKGPVIQNDIFDLLIRFRFPKYAMSADIAKMYRQILVDDKDQFLQLIVWRNSPSDSISIYKLKTVTYGTTPAPFLATKCLQRLGEENEQRFPLASKILRRDFYVDDLLTGFDSIAEASDVQGKLIKMFGNVGMHLRKWCANDLRLLKNVSDEDKEIEWTLRPSEECVKTLGLKWTPKIDCFSLKVIVSSKSITKRIISSESGSIFDPLGFLNPLILKAKLIIQSLWKMKLDWDIEVPSSIANDWRQFRLDLSKLIDWNIPRCVLLNNYKRMELHGFSDASQDAYGAVIYVRSTNDEGEISSKLLCSRSKVAPLKAVTIPKLELSAAKLLVELMDRVKTSIHREVQAIHYWCDSEIVLWWIKKPSTSFKPYVANRVSVIQDFTHPSQWHHIAGVNNPADIVSRGLFIDQLLCSELWFRGPEFLSCEESKWILNEFGHTCNNTDALKEIRSNAVLSISVQDTIKDFDKSNMLEVNHKNRFCTLKRIVGFISRFVQNCKCKIAVKENRKSCCQRLETLNGVQFKEEILRTIEPLTVDELDNSLKLIVRYLQNSFDLCSKKHNLKKLLPFKDSDNILRVGGRLKNSTLPFDTKHPMLLPKCKITQLLLKQYHEDNFHAGPQLLLSIIRQKFWPINGLRSCSKIFYNCLDCFKGSPRCLTQIMGNLPASRTEISAPFSVTGVDYAGPLMVHYKIRGKRPTKAYLAVFVCFTTKAVHLEVVTDLTTAAFIGCLKRFIARRGKPKEIHSDNASNFVGAREEMLRLQTFFAEHDEEIYRQLADRGVKWNNIPAASPHFGGLWESSVKRAKYHLQHLVRNANLTFEELNTVVVEVEYILNSRPITPLSENPSDLGALTPNDFLISGDSSVLPEKDLSGLKIDLLKRWDVVSKIRQTMWSRISIEYFHHLQARSKWLESSKCLKEETLLNRLVLLKNKNSPCLDWERGRITKVIKGTDDLIRVVDVKTSNSIKRRAITEVCPFPLPNEDEGTTPLNESNEKDTSSSHITSRKLSVNKNNKSIGTYKNILISILYLILLMPLVLGANNDQFVNVTTFQRHPGIYFDGVGKINVQKDQWHVITYFNLTSYWSNCNKFSSMINIIKPLCTSEPCLNNIAELEHHVKDILELNLLIKEECHIRELTRSNKINRRRRSYHAPLDLIGKIAHLAFGTLDSEYADNMEKSIANVKSNEDRLLMMIKNHTTILDKTVNVMKQNNAEIINKFKQLHDGYMVLTASQKKTEKQAVFNTLVGYLTLLLMKHREIQKQIHNSLTDFKKGRLNAILINPYELEQHIKGIEDIIGSSNRLPSKHFAELETIAKLAVVHSKNCLIFHIEIPLLRKEEYNLYRMIPVPTIVYDKMMYINPTTDYLVISGNSESYYMMSKLEYQQCSQFYDIKICHQDQVIYHINKDSHCEINFFLHNFEVTKQCDIRYGYRNEYWFELHESNTWLFSVINKQEVKVCNSKMCLSKTISGEGIIKIHPSCTLEVDGVDLPTRKVKYSTLFSEKILSVLPQLDISQNFTVKNTSKPVILKLDNMEDIPKMLEIQKYEEEKALKTIDISDGPDVYHFISFGLFGSLMGAIALLLFCKFLQNRNSNVKVELNTPAPEPHPTYNFRVPENIEMVELS